MSGIASKNPYDLLGNDPDEDPDRAPEPPTKTVDKTAGRTGKRNAPSEAPAARGDRAGRGGRGSHAYSGNEAAFRDRQAGASQNRTRDDGLREDRHRNHIRGGDDERRGRGGRGRGGRGFRGPPRDDRHSKTGVTDHDKQVAHGWGGNTGGEEWADEKAGEAIAKAEEREGFDTNVGPPTNADGEPFAPDNEGAGEFVADTSGEGRHDGGDEAGEPEEPEQKTKSYSDYLAEQAQKKLQLGDNLEARRANEGSGKKFPQGKAIDRSEDDENFFVGGQGKAKRERQKKEKTVLELDGQAMRPLEPRSDRGRGGRGRGRGGDRGEFRDRGERGDRGDRGDRGERPERPERGDYRGRGRGDRPRGDYRGGRGGRGGSQQSGIQINDQSAFPSLGT